MLRVIQHGGTAGLDDAALGLGDQRESISEIFGMLQTDVGNNGDFGAVDDVGGIEGTAHADFKNHDVAVFFHEMTAVTSSNWLGWSSMASA